MAARARVLRDALNARADNLDTIFQFSPLINRNGTIPPVIVEARELSSFSPDQIRTANRVYKIGKEERFVSVPPTWRDYLRRAPDEVQRRSSDLRYAAAEQQRRGCLA
ncbi:MAG: IncI1 plasmid conjugative transfer protein TraI [uncultured Paraburkholderia sp.]|nr:MAG: IncI1 plasmid conjugative transfer protein TraI [uncultured Paraburkholderia sp.]CAH2940115.1 MAG: IncI1 plasmid conjugative transfer protein TraI [uncultured Paraburkholderia sp.]